MVAPPKRVHKTITAKANNSDQHLNLNLTMNDFDEIPPFKPPLNRQICGEQTAEQIKQMITAQQLAIKVENNNISEPQCRKNNRDDDLPTEVCRSQCRKNTRDDDLPTEVCRYEPWPWYQADADKTKAEPPRKPRLKRQLAEVEAEAEPEPEAEADWEAFLQEGKAFWLQQMHIRICAEAEPPRKRTRIDNVPVGIASLREEKRAQKQAEADKLEAMPHESLRGALADLDLGEIKK